MLHIITRFEKIKDCETQIPIFGSLKFRQNGDQGSYSLLQSLARVYKTNQITNMNILIIDLILNLMTSSSSPFDDDHDDNLDRDDNCKGGWSAAPTIRGTMLPGPPALTCFVLLAHVKKFHQKIVIILITLMSVLTILFTRNWRSWCLLQYPCTLVTHMLAFWGRGSATGGYAFLHRRLCLVLVAKNHEYWVTREVLCYTRSRTNS